MLQMQLIRFMDTFSLAWCLFDWVSDWLIVLFVSVFFVSPLHVNTDRTESLTGCIVFLSVLLSHRSCQQRQNRGTLDSISQT